jgi:predicted secreted protein
MAVAPKAALGTLIARGNGASPETYDTLLKARNIQGPGQTVDFVDVTSHSSSGYREVLPSFKNSGECSFELLYDSADLEHAGVFDDYEAKTLRKWKITYTDTGAEIHTFSAYVSNISLAASIDDAVILSVSLKLTTAVGRA